ncbi:hypothetical protein HZ326_2123 [Fusarium oxysporum f. sp. albedinis]|nr:hypothetical protein HZ326_2123 [Fusarium oxysporum f. sp. albedinis]
MAATKFANLLVVCWPRPNLVPPIPGLGFQTMRFHGDNSGATGHPSRSISQLMVINQEQKRGDTQHWPGSVG